MKALTICQPYAELILRGEKPVENRTWRLSHRGPLLIHAGKSRAWLNLGDELNSHDGLPIAEMAFGALVGVASVLACLSPAAVRRDYRRIAGSEHIEGPWCTVLAEVRRFLEPIPYRGQPGVFDVPDALVRDAIQRSTEVTCD